MPSLSFWGGMRCIGGTKVVVAEDGYRFIFDFGLEYSPQFSLFNDTVRLRRDRLVRDYLRLGYLPPLTELYAQAGQDDVALTKAHITVPSGPEFRPESDCASGPADPPVPIDLPGRTAVFVSHLHLDHCALMGCVDPEIPVLVPEATYRLLHALQICRVDGPETHRTYVPVPDGATLRLGPLAVQVLAVDHDTPGTSGLIIHTGAGAVVYSSDLRLHGTAPHRTRAFAAAARAARPAALLMEGTRLGEDPARAAARFPEAVVPDRMVAALSGCAGLGIMCVYHRNPERLETARQAALATGRTLAVSADHAYVHAACGYSLAGVVMYLTGEQTQDRQQGRLPAWLDRWLECPDSPELVTTAAVSANQDRFLVQLAYAHFPELVDLSPARGSLFLHSGGEPLGGFDPAWGNLLRWLNAFSLSLVRVHSSGHASPSDLEWLIREMDPTALVPIHSLHPELMAPDHPRRHWPEYGSTVPIAALGR